MAEQGNSGAPTAPGAGAQAAAAMPAAAGRSAAPLSVSVKRELPESAQAAGPPAKRVQLGLSVDVGSGQSTPVAQEIETPSKLDPAWTDTDDVALIQAAKEGYSLEQIAATSAGRFSKPFDLATIMARYRSVMFHEEVAHGVAAKLQARGAPPPAPWSHAEEGLLADMMAQGMSLREILNLCRNEFAPHRTLQQLHERAAQLEGKIARGYVRTVDARGRMLPFSHVVSQVEKLGNACFLAEESAEDAFGFERPLLSRMRHLEREFEQEWPVNALAILKGMRMRVAITRRITTFGRSAQCDIVVSGEGDASKVSRKQAVIKLHYGGFFVLSNVGRRIMLVNGEVVKPGTRSYLPHNCLISVGGLHFVLVVHRTLLQRIAETVARVPTATSTSQGGTPSRPK